VCVLVAQGIPCLGPVVHGGCGALCPANGRGCYGCFGPSSAGNFTSVVSMLTPLERFPGEAALLLHNFSCYAPAFRKAAEEAAQASRAKEAK
jgi:coenzyme F420-reducing hydrogenase gamma subunit